MEDKNNRPMLKGEPKEMLVTDRNSPEDRIPFLVDIGEHMQERLESGQSVLQDNNPPQSSAPFNGLSGSTYKDINQLILAQEAKDKGYQSDVWLTFTQTGNLQGSVKSGESPTTVQFVTWKNTDQTDRKTPLYSSYGVYNLEQTKGVDQRKLRKPPGITKIDQQAMSMIFDGTAPRNSGEEIGNWMAAAHYRIPLAADKGVNLHTLTTELQVNNAMGNHSQVFRLVNHGQVQSNLLSKTLTNFKERVMSQALINNSDSLLIAEQKVPTAKAAPKAKAKPKAKA